MTTVASLISKSGLDFLLNPREFKNIMPWGSDKLCEFIEGIREDADSKVIIVPDSDVDGILSAKGMLDTLSLVTMQDINVYEHTYKTHGLSLPMLYGFLRDGYTHVVIVDSSSGDMEELQWLSAKGIKVLVIDHHMTPYSLSDYPENVLILNNKLCLKEGINVPYKEVSCGALVALYCNYIHAKYHFVFPATRWASAVTTLYSDGMDLFDEFNVMLIAYARKHSSLDSILSGISAKRDTTLSRELLTFSISPKINACVKANHFKPVQELFFDKNITAKRQKQLCKELNDFNGYIKEHMATVESSLIPIIKGAVGVIDMTQFINDEIADFKGTIANRAAESAGKLIIAYYRKNSICYASVRDPFNRDALSVFQEITNAAGHKSAFGFSVPEVLLESVVRYVNQALDEVSSARRNPLIIPADKYSVSAEDIYQMAIINEYAVNNGVFLQVNIDPDLFRIDNYRGMYTLRSTRFQLLGTTPVNYGDTVLAVPTLGSKTSIKIKTIVRS